MKDENAFAKCFHLLNVNTATSHNVVFGSHPQLLFCRRECGDIVLNHILSRKLTIGIASD